MSVDRHSTPPPQVHCVGPASTTWQTDRAFQHDARGVQHSTEAIPLRGCRRTAPCGRFQRQRDMRTKTDRRRGCCRRTRRTSSRLSYLPIGVRLVPRLKGNGCRPCRARSRRFTGPSGAIRFGQAAFTSNATGITNGPIVDPGQNTPTAQKGVTTAKYRHRCASTIRLRDMPRLIERNTEDAVRRCKVRRYLTSPDSDQAGPVPVLEKPQPCPNPWAPTADHPIPTATHGAQYRSSDL